MTHFRKIMLFSALFSTMTYASSPHPRQLRYNSEDLKLDSEAVGQWASKVKGEVNSSMLDENSEFGKFLAANGDMTDRERHVLSYFVEVRPVEQLKNVYAALFYSRLHMNKTLIRTSLFNDGGPGVKKGELPPSHSLFLHESMEAARGLNLKGSQINKFYQLAQQNDYSLYEEEKVFKPILDNLMDTHPDGNFYLIAFNIVGLSMDTFGHEVNHALFETNINYKNIIKNFWHKKLTDSERQLVRDALGAIYEGEDVIIDEFQAYLLQPEVPAAQSSLLPHKVVLKYKNELIAILRKNNVPVAFAPTCESFFTKSFKLGKLFSK
ncbi:MAG: hypothetical protein H6622_07505 [Halobacteriovoraceae bacterium]|nr:hypothetical protein [Halobacteriovoraceae bacterium]